MKNIIRKHYSNLNARLQICGCCNEILSPLRSRLTHHLACPYKTAMKPAYIERNPTKFSSIKSHGQSVMHRAKKLDITVYK